MAVSRDIIHFLLKGGSRLLALARMVRFDIRF
jgi:hypothetical protein